MLHRYRPRTRQIAVSLSFGLATVGWLSVAPAAAQEVSSAHVISAPL